MAWLGRRAPVSAGKKKRLILWLLARQAQWSRLGKDAKGRPIRWTCPGTCKTTTPRADPFGCHGEITPPLHERHAQKFADAPGPVPYCPWRFMRDNWSPWLGVVLDLYRDRDKGIPGGWPEDYTAAVVEAVRLVESESRAAEAAVMDEISG